MYRNGWVPISSGKLPDEEVDVQITYIGYKDEKPYCNYFAYISDGKWYWSADDYPVEVEITAWRRMCEPYRGK